MNTKTKIPANEKELLAMGEQHYMNEAQLAYFRRLLQQQQQDLLGNAAATGEHLKEFDLAADPADRATQEEENALELRVRDRERKLLSKIDEALLRIDEGTYGWCAETGDPIGLPRLLARPTAALSIEAQERRERLQKTQGE